MSEAQIEMPRYQCHKVVHALKIDIIDQDHSPENVGGGIITSLDDGYAPIVVDAEYMLKHRPQSGGYYVVYEDGYKSWSPGKAFEQGYDRI